jgi:hypothetical protein
MKDEWGGIRTPPSNTEKTQSGPESGAESGAVGARNDAPDPDLARLIEALPTLTETARRVLVGFLTQNAGKLE